MSGSVFGTSLLVVGPEQLLRERAVTTRVRDARRQAPDAELIELDGAGMDVGALTEATGGSLFAQTTIVVVHALSEVDKDLFDLVASVAAQPSDDLCLIMDHPGGNKGRGLLNKLRKAKVTTVKADQVKPWKIPDFIAHEARGARLRMDRAAIDSLHRALGNDLRTLAAAVQQLADDSDGHVDSQQVSIYFGGRAEVTSYAVADAIMAGHVDKALEDLRWALDSGVSPTYITTVMAGSLRNLGRYLDARTRRMANTEIAAVIGVPPWKIKDLEAQRRHWDSAAVARALRHVVQADAAVKGAAVDAHYALEAMVLEVEQARVGR